MTALEREAHLQGWEANLSTWAQHAALWHREASCLRVVRLKWETLVEGQTIIIVGDLHGSFAGRYADMGVGCARFAGFAGFAGCAGMLGEQLCVQFSRAPESSTEEHLKRAWSRAPGRRM